MVPGYRSEYQDFSGGYAPIDRVRETQDAGGSTPPPAGQPAGSTPGDTQGGPPGSYIIGNMMYSAEGTIISTFSYDGWTPTTAAEQAATPTGYVPPGPVMAPPPAPAPTTPRMTPALPGATPPPGPVPASPPPPTPGTSTVYPPPNTNPSAPSTNTPPPTTPAPQTAPPGGTTGLSTSANIYGGGASGARQLAGQSVYDQLNGMLTTPGYSDAEKSAITQEGMNAATAAYAGMGGQIKRRAAATNNSAGVNSALSQMGRAQAGTLGEQARQNTIGFGQEAQRQTEWGTQGMAQLYGGETGYLANLLGQSGSLASRLRATSTRQKNVTDQPFMTIGL